MKYGKAYGYMAATVVGQLVAMFSLAVLLTAAVSPLSLTVGACGVAAFVLSLDFAERAGYAMAAAETGFKG